MVRLEGGREGQVSGRDAERSTQLGPWSQDGDCGGHYWALPGGHNPVDLVYSVLIAPARNAVMVCIAKPHGDRRGVYWWTGRG